MFKNMLNTQLKFEFLRKRLVWMSVDAPSSSAPDAVKKSNDGEKKTETQGALEETEKVRAARREAIDIILKIDAERGHMVKFEDLHSATGELAADILKTQGVVGTEDGAKCAQMVSLLEFGLVTNFPEGLKGLDEALSLGKVKYVGIGKKEGIPVWFFLDENKKPLNLNLLKDKNPNPSISKEIADKVYDEQKQEKEAGDRVRARAEAEAEAQRLSPEKLSQLNTREVFLKNVGKSEDFFKQLENNAKADLSASTPFRADEFKSALFGFFEQISGGVPDGISAKMNMAKGDQEKYDLVKAELVALGYNAVKVSKGKFVFMQTDIGEENGVPGKETNILKSTSELYGQPVYVNENVRTFEQSIQKHQEGELPKSPEDRALELTLGAALQPKYAGILRAMNKVDVGQNVNFDLELHDGVTKAAFIENGGIAYLILDRDFKTNGVPNRYVWYRGENAKLRMMKALNDGTIFQEQQFSSLKMKKVYEQVGFKNLFDEPKVLDETQHIVSFDLDWRDWKGANPKVTAQILPHGIISFSVVRDGKSLGNFMTDNMQSMKRILDEMETANKEYKTVNETTQILWSQQVFAQKEAQIGKVDGLTYKEGNRAILKLDWYTREGRGEGIELKVVGDKKFSIPELDGAVLTFDEMIQKISEMKSRLSTVEGGEKRVVEVLLERMNIDDGLQRRGLALAPGIELSGYSTMDVPELMMGSQRLKVHLGSRDEIAKAIEFGFLMNFSDTQTRESRGEITGTSVESALSTVVDRVVGAPEEKWKTPLTENFKKLLAELHIADNQKLLVRSFSGSGVGVASRNAVIDGQPVTICLFTPENGEKFRTRVYRGFNSMEADQKLLETPDWQTFNQLNFANEIKKAIPQEWRLDNVDGPLKGKIMDLFHTVPSFDLVDKAMVSALPGNDLKNPTDAKINIFISGWPYTFSLKVDGNGNHTIGLVKGKNNPAMPAFGMIKTGTFEQLKAEFVTMIQSRSAEHALK